MYQEQLSQKYTMTKIKHSEAVKAMILNQMLTKDVQSRYPKNNWHYLFLTTDINTTVDRRTRQLSRYFYDGLQTRKRGLLEVGRQEGTVK